jgi:hypothetical protein
MKTAKFEFPFFGYKGRNERNLRLNLVNLLNNGQSTYRFGTFETHATNFHCDGCIYAVEAGDVAYNRNSNTIVFCREYGSSLPSVYSDGETMFDRAYIAAREFVRANCGI